MSTELGLIEGFYGRPWSWQARADTVSALAPHGYRFYHYAPKADPYLRRQWQQEHPRAEADALARLATHCRSRGVRLGVGLSPYELHLNFDQPARDALARKLTFLDDLGVEDLALLFDDVRGDLPDLAERQIEITHWAAARTRARRVLFCPSYYASDPLLDKVFGQRPPRYLETLGESLDPRIEIFWSGPEVCSRALSPGHLAAVAETLRRRPFLWDNYPVNDGAVMSRHLHLRGFTGRPASIAAHVAGHAINVALQPTLTRLPAITLARSYQQGDDYDYLDAFHQAAREVLGESLGAKVITDLAWLNDRGLDRLGPKTEELRERYTQETHPAALEIMAWLEGEYSITDEEVQTQ